MSIEWTDVNDAVVEHHLGSYLDGYEEPVDGRGLLITGFDGDGIVIQGNKREIMAFLTRCMEVLEHEPFMLDEDGYESNPEILNDQHAKGAHGDGAEPNCMYCEMLRGATA